MSTILVKRLAVLMTCLVATTLTGCGWTATDLPLPGGGLPGPSYELKAEFADVLNLPEKAKVSLDGVEVGQVMEIEVEGYTATVTMAILEEFRLAKGTTLELRQATALGEVFVAVNAPDQARHGYFAVGDTIPVDATGSAPSIEDTLAALSTLINGGGLSNLKTIVEEANTIFDGRIPVTRELLSELRTMMTTVRSRTAAIRRILDSMDSLTLQVIERRPAIDRLLRDVTPAVRELGRQRGQFVAMLASFDDLASTSTRLLDATGEHAVQTFDRLGPVLDGFIALDQDLEPAILQMLKLHQALRRVTRGSAGTSTIKVNGVVGLPLLGPGATRGER